MLMTYRFGPAAAAVQQQSEQRRGHEHPDHDAGDVPARERGRGGGAAAGRGDVLQRRGPAGTHR